jgi:DNA-binding SARP family transcriptional activator
MPGGEVSYVQLLGAARIRVGLKWTTFAPDKRHQLLAYLAYSSDWVSREKLAYLFWPDTSTQKAQQNLRQLLHRVRSLPWLSGPQVEAQRLRWPIETDVKLFKRALENNNLDEALSLYGGPLLENLESAEATEFNSWLEIEREGLHSQWRDALLRRVRELKERERHHEAIRLLGALLDHDPFDEEALLAYLDAATRAGQREQALKAYRDYAHRLRDELDLEPTLVVQSLAQAIQDRETNLLDSLPSPPAPTSTANLKVFPTPATSFVGRELELSEIVHLLSKPECRLLTLTGPGGIGKTRTALQAMQELAEDYSGGSYFVPLDSLTAPELIPSAIAEALGLKLHGQDEPLVQVIRYIGKKQILLVLDNYEQLLEGAILASRLIQDCPRLKLLITSRERLNLAEEWLLPVEGLPYPPLTPLPAASPLLGGTEGVGRISMPSRYLCSEQAKFVPALDLRMRNSPTSSRFAKWCRVRPWLSNWQQCG